MQKPVNLSGKCFLAATALVVVATVFPLHSLQAVMADSNPTLSLADGKKLRDTWAIGTDGHFLVQVTPGAGTVDEFSLTKREFVINGAIRQTVEITASSPLALRIPGNLKNQAVFVTVVETYTATDKPAEVRTSTPPIEIYNDLEGPQLAAFPEAEHTADAKGKIILHFKHDDLENSPAKEDFAIRRKIMTSFGEGFEPVAIESASKTDSRTVQLNVARLYPGPYELLLQTTLEDEHGNPASALAVPFDVRGEREQGSQVNYPRNLGPANLQNDIDPGNRVDTRDVRLYYFRDAHRVAELINRNVRSLNKVGYDSAQRIAAQARDRAERSTDDRRRLELLAVQTAELENRTRSELDAVRNRLQEAISANERLNPKINDLKQQIGNIRESDGLPRTSDLSGIDEGYNDGGYDAAIKKALDAEGGGVEDITPGPAVTAMRRGRSGRAFVRLQSPDSQDADRLITLDVDRLIANRARVRELNAELRRLDTVAKNETALTSKLQQTVAEFESNLTTLQLKAVTDRNKLATAERFELRNAQNQFRREVAAGLADRDSYVPGNTKSIDPVNQVTISVVGEGVLQLRGPMSGINKIRRMVHQIDSPTGQVKIGIHTVQINGERGDRMERVYEQIDRQVAISRFLTTQSLLMFRKAVARVASRRATMVDGGHLPSGYSEDFYDACASADHDAKYLFSFFGHDFIQELQKMDSELLRSDNKLLSLHSMDTLSLAGALNVSALANNEIRREIINEFCGMIQTDLPMREIDYYRSLTRTHHKSDFFNKLTTRRKRTRLDERDAQRLMYNANRTYHFSNLIGFFDAEVEGAGTLNNMQFATLRLAQTLKSQLIAERELQNLIKERTLLEVEPGETERDYKKKASDAETTATTARNEAATAAGLAAKAQTASVKARQQLEKLGAEVEKIVNAAVSHLEPGNSDAARLRSFVAGWRYRLQRGQASPTLLLEVYKQIPEKDRAEYKTVIPAIIKAVADQRELSSEIIGAQAIDELVKEAKNLPSAGEFFSVLNEWDKQRQREIQYKDDQTEASRKAKIAEGEATRAEFASRQANDLLFSKRMLNQFIDEQEEKAVELLEALRAHSSNVDNYLKRLAIALEDDLDAQFYSPAFQKIRRVSRTYDVQLGQIETTNVVTNNRSLGKVSPSATMEFDLPQRDIVLTEALNGGRALVTEYGNLVESGAFLAATRMFSGQPAPGLVNSRSPMQEIPGLMNDVARPQGSALESLIPRPSVYKFETGTGFEVRPVIQQMGTRLSMDSITHTQQTSVSQFGLTKGILGE